MTGRPEDAYRVAARIEGPSGRRGRVLAILAAVLAVAWGAAVLGGQGSDRPGLVTGSADASVVAQAPRSPLATYPPDVQIIDPRAPRAPIPVELGSLAFLEPRGGTVNPVIPPDWSQQHVFASSGGGAICICIEPEISPRAPATLHALRFAGNGVLVNDALVPGWEPLAAAGGFALDVQRIPGTPAVALASAAASSGRWTIRLDWLDPETGNWSDREVASYPAAGLAGVDVTIRLAVAPDGRRLRLWLGDGGGSPASSPAPGLPQVWTVPITNGQIGGFGEPVPRVEPWLSDPATVCTAEAWATSTTFVQLCHATSFDENGLIDTALRIDRGDGGRRQVDLGPGLPGEPSGWLVDGSNGTIYGWFTLSHRLVRIDATTGAITAHVLGAALASLADIVPVASMPPPRTGLATWQPFDMMIRPLAGSLDGSMLYAIGDQGAVVPGGVESTGVLAFDAASLALVGHWPAAAHYDTIALTQDGQTLFATGDPGDDELRTYGSHGPLITFEDARDGTYLSVLRGMRLRLGHLPEPLAPALPERFGG